MLKPILAFISVVSLCLCLGCGRGGSTLSKIAQNVETTNSQISGPVRGNKQSHIYHWAGCPEYDRIAPDNRVEFQNASQAEQAGYRAALNCPKQGNDAIATSEPKRQPPSYEPGTRSYEPPTRQPAEKRSRETISASTKDRDKNKSEKEPSNAEGTKVSQSSEGKPTVKVWVSKDSNVYHCPGSARYGATKDGEYITQRAALKKGLHPDHGAYCQ